MENISSQPNFKAATRKKGVVSDLVTTRKNHRVEIPNQRTVFTAVFPIQKQRGPRAQRSFLSWWDPVTRPHHGLGRLHFHVSSLLPRPVPLHDAMARGTG